MLTLFCQDIEEEAEHFEARAKGKGKNNRIPIMLIGQGRGGKSSLMRRLLGLPLVLRHAHARGIITAKEQQD